jgi:hypothetical protein
MKEPAVTRFNGFVHAHGDTIVDGADQPLLLRGMGLGNWLLPEGYMWKFGDDTSSPRQIEAHLEKLVGADRAAEFWAGYRDTYITEADVARIAELGYDHVRLPLNSRYLVTDDGVFLEDGFSRVNDLISWCERHNLWVLLDLHGAPGGQTGTNIDDSPNGKPELFMERRWWDLTIRLWEEIARRYRHETVVLGYDLLNEPLPNEWQHTYPAELAQLYKELTSAIRAIDPDHLLVYEGAHWATNWSIFTEVWDQNSALQFHRYWCAPDESSIDEYLSARTRLGLPIYMGEGGENTAEWIYTAHRLYERHQIGWNFWPWKKLDTLTSPVSATRPDHWELISDPAADVDPDTAWSILTAYLDAIALENCVENADVVNAMFGRGPLTVPAWGHTPKNSIRHLDALGETTRWHHTAGEPYTADEILTIELSKGDELRFALDAQPAQWSLDGEQTDHLVTGWHHGHLMVRANGPASLRSITLHA